MVGYQPTIGMFYFHFSRSCLARSYARVGGLGLKSPLSLKIYKTFITCAKEINCFHILLPMPLNGTPPMKALCVRH